MVLNIWWKCLYILWIFKMRLIKNFVESQKLYMKVRLQIYLLLLTHFSRVWLCAAPEMAAHQAPLSLGFSRQEHWSGLPFPSPMHESEKWKWSHWVVSNSQQPHGLQPTRLLHPWNFPGKSTGVGCHCLLQQYRIAIPKLYWHYSMLSWKTFFPQIRVGRMASGWFKPITFTMHFISIIITLAPPQIIRRLGIPGIEYKAEWRRNKEKANTLWKSGIARPLWIILQFLNICTS